MKAKINPTRERILHSGLDLLSETGLSGITLGILAERVQLSKSGLFAHFRSKEDVQISLLRHMAAVAGATVITPALACSEGLPRLRELVRLWLGWPERAGLRGGCPIAAAVFETDDQESLVRDQVLAMEAHFREMLTQMVQDAVRLGHLRADLDAEQFVWELCGIYLSHHASARLLRAPDALARAETAWEALLARSSDTGLEQKSC